MKKIKSGRFFNSALLNQQGLSVIELMVSLGLMAFLGFGVFSIKQSSTKQRVQMDTFLWLTDAKEIFQNTLKDDKAYENTLAFAANATSVACLKNTTDCRGVSQSLTLVDKNGLPLKYLSDPGNLSNGLSFKGEPCNSFNPATGNLQCPFRYEAKWAAICPPLPKNCINPIVEFRITLKYKPGASGSAPPVNTAGYSVTFNRTENTADTVENCSSIGGFSYDPTTKECRTLYMQECGPGYFLRGFSDNGQPVCEFMRGYECEKGQVFLGIDVDGTVHCGPGCSNLTSKTGDLWSGATK